MTADDQLRGRRGARAAPAAVPASASAPRPPDEPVERDRGCLGTVAVLMAMIAIVGLGALGAGAVAELPDVPIAVSRGVTLTPPTGWEFAGRSDDGNGILLTSGIASVFVETRPGSDEHAALGALRAEWSSEPTLTLGEVERLEIRPGVAAARFAYSGTVAEVASAIEGEVIALRGSGYVALFDGWASIGEYLAARAEIERMIVQAVLP